MKNMNKKEGKKIGVMTAVILGFMVIAFMPAASATVTSFTVTPSTGIAGAVDSYDVFVITTGVTSINITIPAGFLAVAPPASVEVARVDFWNSTAKAYYGHATITSDATNPTAKVAVYCKFGADAVTKTQNMDYTAGATTTIESGFPSDDSSAIIKLANETLDGSINITINCTAFQLDAVMIAIKQFVKNPTAGDYTFYADGKEAKVEIKEPSGNYGGGVRRGEVWILRTENSPGAMVYRFAWGSHTDVPCPGDWNGVGGDGIGVYRNGQWILRNDTSAGDADYRFNYGNPSNVPVTGDWNKDGEDGIGVYRNGQWILRNDKSAGDADYRFNYGNPSDVPVTGDWNKDGEDGIGVYRNGQWILRNYKSAGAADYSFNFGSPSDVPVTGDWNGDGEDGIGVYRNGQWILRNDKSAGAADYRFNWGLPTDVSVPGTWA
jgi:hypothetical protein